MCLPLGSDICCSSGFLIQFALLLSNLVKWRLRFYFPFINHSRPILEVARPIFQLTASARETLLLNRHQSFFYHFLPKPPSYNVGRISETSDDTIRNNMGAGNFFFLLNRTKSPNYILMIVVQARQSKES